jgi:GGDEF domain-containing protein
VSASALAQDSGNAADTWKLPSLFANSRQLALPEPMGVLIAPKTAQSSPAKLRSSPQKNAFKPWQPGMKLESSTEQDVWLRLVLPATKQPQTWILRVPRLALDQATLHYTLPEQTTTWLQQSAGARLPRSEWPMRARDPAFELSTLPSQTQLFFIQIDHRQAVTEDIQLIQTSDFADGANYVGTLYGTIFGIFLILTLGSIISAWIHKSSHFYWLALFCFTVMLAQLTVAGYMSVRVWPNSVYLTGTAGWILPLLSLAALTRLVISLSYARELSQAIYWSLWALIAACFLLTGVVMMMPLEASRNFINPFYALGMAQILFSLSWIAWRSQHWLWMVVISITPVMLSVLARLAYNMGWVAHVDLALMGGVITSGLGLLITFAVMYLHERESISAQQRHLALENTDASTGLFNERIAMARFPQILLRSKRFERPCGAILLRWLDFDRVMTVTSSTQRGRIFSHLGKRLGRLARDIDTVARIDDDLFIFLVEAPVTREDINELASRILTNCLRPSAVMPETKGFDLHLAVWLSNEVMADSVQAMELLKTRINQMRTGTQRRVQFVDTGLSTGPQGEKDPAAHAAELVAKINALEATQGLPKIQLPPREIKPN